jgi:hypothetical protein
VAAAMIGVDPHKRSHTAFALDASEKRLGQVRVHVSIRQVDGLLEWAWRGADGACQIGCVSEVA